MAKGDESVGAPTPRRENAPENPVPITHAERAAPELQRVISEYEEELRRRQYTREIAAAILEGRPLRDIADMVIEMVAQRLRVERVGIFLRDGKDHIVPIALSNLSTEFGANVARIAQRTPTRPRSTATGLPIYIRQIQRDNQIAPEMQSLLASEKITSLLMAMLQHGALVRGAIIVYTTGERQFTPLELSSFQSFADMATLGIALSQQMEQRREVAMIEERNRLAREIHDTVAQSLAALSLQLETAQTFVDGGDIEAVGEILAGARAQAHRALQETRRAVQGLAPEALETMSPAQAISREVEMLGEQSDLVTQFILTGEEQELSPDQGLTLLRIAQEALSNARRHSQAQRVRVGLQYGAEEATLLVEDDGAGFDIQQRGAPGPEGGYGLFGMEERARLIGGRLEIESTPGWGTRIRTVLPYRPAFVPVSAALPIEERPEAAVVSSEPATPVPISTPDSPSLRVLIADDHALVRQGIRSMLEVNGDITVVGQAENGAQAVELAQELRPDVVLLDLQMPDVDGLEALRRIRAQQPDLSVIILTTFQSDDAVSDSLQAGARGFLLKDAGSGELIAAVHAAHRGETVLTPSVTHRLASLASGHANRTDLSERELEVLQLLARGARNKEIGAALFIAPKSVEYHLSNIFSKLGVSNRTEAARIAIERGLVVAGSRALK